MKRHLSSALLVLLMLCGCVANGETPPPQPPARDLPPPETPQAAAFYPGQAIVRFAASSPAAEAVGRALEGRAHQEPALEAYLRELSGEIGVPVTAKQLGSGGELLLEVDREALQAALREHLAADPRVEATSPVDTTAESPFASPGIEVRATLTPAESGRSAAGLEELAAELCDGLELPVEGTPEGPDEIGVRADLTELTDELLRRLAEHPAVESAEPNRLMTRQQGM